jgi:mono/diheme cytochrome c family protein
MRRIASAVLAVGLLAFVSLVTVVAFQQPKSPYPPAKPMTLASPATSAARGTQLVMLGGCNDCHTPKLPNGEPGVTRMLSGHPQDAPLAPEVKGGFWGEHATDLVAGPLGA